MTPSVRLQTQVPGPRSRELSRMMEENTPRGVFHVTPIAISQGKGALVTDVDGNTYIDFAGGIGTLNVGHCADEVVAAIKDQADRYLHTCFHVTIYEPYVQLAKRLNEITPGDFPKKTMLANSGAEAVENAVKIARFYTKRHAVLAFEHAFHGRTILALSLTSQIDPYKFGFGPFLPEVYRLPYAYCYRCPFELKYPACGIHCADNVEEVFKTHVSADSVAAVIAEPVLGEGGFVVPPPEFFPRLKAICEAHGILFIADEIQTGWGRTGKMFAMDHFQVQPDILLTAKSLGGGMVLSGITGKAEMMDAPHIGGLGGTFGGNPVACRAALAALEVIEGRGLLSRAEHIGDRIRRRFEEMAEQYRIIGDVRGLGAMVALELVKDRGTKEPAAAETALILKTCCEKGLIILRAGAYHNVLRVLVPLVITEEQLDEGLAILDAAIAEVAL